MLRDTSLHQMFDLFIASLRINSSRACAAPTITMWDAAERSTGRLNGSGRRIGLTGLENALCVVFGRFVMAFRLYGCVDLLDALKTYVLSMKLFRPFLRLGLLANHAIDDLLWTKVGERQLWLTTFLRASHAQPR